MQLLFSFIHKDDNISTEFAYVGRNGVSIESGNHTVHILQSIEANKEDLENAINELPFGDKDMYSTAMFEPDVRYVLLSLFTDPNLGLYRNKQSGITVAFGEYTNDLTDTSKWESYINKTVFTAGCDFTKENLQMLRDHYEFLGRLTPQQIIENLEKIYSYLSSETILILNLGSETPYLSNTQSAYTDRHEYNRELNNAVRGWASHKERISLLDVNKYITGQESFTNNINHFTKKVYYDLSEEFIQIINEERAVKLVRRTMLEQSIVKVLAVPARAVKKFKRILNKQ